MSYFLCLSVPGAGVEALRGAFDSSVSMTEASTFPIGKATRGQHASWCSFLLQIGSSSAFLIGKGAARKTHNNDRSALLISGIQALLLNECCSSVSLLFHWMQGLIANEPIAVQRQEKLSAADFARMALALEEDVRYVITT